jgi:hypothetical protein
LQLTKNRFLTLQGESDDVLKQIAAWDDLWVQVAGFVFILAGDRDMVSAAVLSSNDEFKRAAVEFVHDVPFPEIQKAAREILEMLAEISTSNPRFGASGEGAPRPN